MKKHNFKLTKEEQEIENAIERGEYTTISNLEEEKKRLAEAARYTLEKSKTINIRLTERDYIHLKAKAANEGIPYQTFVASLIHKNT